MSSKNISIDDKTPEVKAFESSPAFDYFFKLYPDEKLWKETKASEFVLTFNDNMITTEAINNVFTSDKENIKAQASFYKYLFEKYNSPYSSVKLPKVAENDKIIADETELSKGLKVLETLYKIRKIEYIRDIASNIVNKDIDEQTKEKKISIVDKYYMARDKMDLRALSRYMPQEDLCDETNIKIAILNGFSREFTEKDISLCNNILRMKNFVERSAKDVDDSLEKDPLHDESDWKRLKDMFDALDEVEMGVLVSQLNAKTREKVCSLFENKRAMIEDSYSSVISVLNGNEMLNENKQEL